MVYSPFECLCLNLMFGIVQCYAQTVSVMGFLAGCCFTIYLQQNGLCHVHDIYIYILYIPTAVEDL